MKKTAHLRVVHAGTPGDKIQISDARGITYRFELQTEEFYRTDETCLPVQIGKTPAETGNRLYRKMQSLLAISATVDAGGVMTLQQDYEGDVQPMEIVGDTFEVVNDWA
jgi:hypothetical protein